MKNVYLILAAFLVAFTSCKNDDNGGGTIEPTVTAPASYSFTRDGKSTVSFGGQTTRIKMATEMTSAMTKFDSLTEDKLMNMFKNENNPFADASLNSSTKTVRSKTAASKEYFSSNTTASNKVKAFIEDALTKQYTVVKPRKDENASAGIAGQVNDGGKARYVNEKGIELNQIAAKSLIGALITDQALNNYLSSQVLDESTNRADNNAGTVASGKTYTTMEHKWDEAYGYVYGLEQDATTPKYGADSFLNKYIARVDGDADFTGIGTTIFNAFKLGRAAIVAKNYKVRDEQVNILRKEISKVIGVRAVYYLQGGKKAIEGNNREEGFHDLSEGIGFVYSLQFTQNPDTGKPYLSAADVDKFVADMNAGNGLWDVKASKLDTWSTKIANAFDFTVEQAGK